MSFVFGEVVLVFGKYYVVLCVCNGCRPLYLEPNMILSGVYCRLGLMFGLGLLNELYDVVAKELEMM